MYCSRCGGEMPIGSKCPDCGNKQKHPSFFWPFLAIILLVFSAATSYWSYNEINSLTLSAELQAALAASASDTSDQDFLERASVPNAKSKTPSSYQATPTWETYDYSNTPKYEPTQTAPPLSYEELDSLITASKK